MAEFLVETYASRETTCGLAGTVQELALAAQQVSEPGAEVRLMGAVLLRADETCFYLYQPASADTVRAAVARGPLDLERVTEAVLIRPAQTGAPGRQTTPLAIADK
jgi:hypothetical protein